MILSVVIYVLSVSASLFCGYPKSMISAQLSHGNSEERVWHITIDKLVDEHKVVLHCLLIDLAKVGLCNRYEAVAVLEDERRIGVAS